MSRSRKKTPICGYATASSEKKDKKEWHRRYRRAEKQALANGDEQPHYKEVSNVWSMSKDGKHYCPDYDNVYRK